MLEEEEFTRAAALFKGGKYHEAISAYVAIHAVDTAASHTKARALNNISGCYASLKDYEASKKMAQQAIDLQPSNAKAHGRLATALEALKLYGAAVLSYETARLLDSANPAYAAGAQRCRTIAGVGRSTASAAAKDEYYYKKSLERATEAMQEASFHEAIRHFGKALDLFPASATSREKSTLLCNRSAAYFRAERFEESADDALEATKADDTYARAYFRLGAAKAKLKKVGDAYDALTVCVRLDPAHADAARLLAEVLPEALESRKTPEERSRDAVRSAQEWISNLFSTPAPATAPRAPAPAHGAGYAYCNFCNETGHSRADCPLLRRKRTRPT